MAADSLLNVKFIREKKLLSQYFGEIAKDSQRYCFAIDADVTTASLQRCPIIDINTAGTESIVLGHYAGQLERFADKRFVQSPALVHHLHRAVATGEGLVAAPVKCVIAQPHPAPCVELTFLDGRSVVCTPSHPFMTSDGIFRSAEQLRPMLDAVRCTIRGFAVVDDEEDAERGGVEWSWSLPLGPLTAGDERDRLLAFGSLLGALLLSISHRPHTAEIECQLRMDAEQVEDWIARCGHQPLTGPPSSPTPHSVVIPASLLDSLVFAVSSPFSVPSPLLVSGCPSALITGFLRGLFGAAASAPQLSGGSPDGQMSPLHLSLEGLASYHTCTLLKDVLLLLSRLGVMAELSGGSEGASPSLFILPAGLSSFSSRVGFGAAWWKSCQLEAAVIIGDIQRHSAAHRQWSHCQLASLIEAEPVLCPPLTSSPSGPPALPSFSLPFISARSAGVHPVFDLSVPLTSSFVVDGLIAHNCFGVKDTLAALESGAVEELIVWESLDIARLLLKNKESGVEKVAYLTEKQERDPAMLKEDGVELEVVDRISLLEWLANNFKSFGAKLQFVTNKSQEGSQFVRGFGGIGGLLRYQLDFLAMEAVDEEEDDFI